MTEPGSTNPRIVRRTRPAPTAPRPTARRTARGAAAAATEPGPDHGVGQDPTAAPHPAAARDRAAGDDLAAEPGRASGRDRPARRSAAQVPRLGPAAYAAPTVAGARGALLLRLAGLLALLGALLTVVGDLQPYLVLDGSEVRAGQDVWSVLAHLVLLLLAGGAGALMLAGRGGRVGPALIAAPAATALGVLLRHVFAGTDPVSHDGAEYYFGELYTTATIEGLLGRTLAIAGAALLLAAGIAAAAAWSDIAERDLLPLGAARRVAGGAAGLAALLAVVGYLVPAAATRIVKYTDPSGLVLTQQLQQPQSMVSTHGLNLLGGVLLLAGWVLAAAVTGALTSRVTIVAALAGMGGLALHGALLNLREIAQGPDLVAGPRLYLLLGSALVALGTAWYAARVRDGSDEQLLSV